ncbi:MAG: leucine-rich repeat protein [Candidatus Coproplasma sp.]
MRSILISHSNEEPDKGITMELYRYLSERKIDCWVDALLKTGNWKDQIGKIMFETPIVIFVASANSMKSKEVMGEVGYYKAHQNEGKVIIPFIIDEKFYLNPDGEAGEAIYDFGANRLEAVFLEKYSTHEEAFERLIRLLPESVSRLENNPADFEYAQGDKVLVGYIGSDACVTVPPYVNEIADEAFLNNDAVRKVIIPPSVEKIGMRAFYGCSNLLEVVGMEGVIEIEATAFECTAIEPCEDNGYCYADVAFGGEPINGELTIKEGVKTVANEAFRYSDVKTITFPQSLKSIGAVAFAECIFLTSLRIPASVERIGKYAFRGCKSLKSVVFEGDIPQGAQAAFDNFEKLIQGGE